MAFKCRDELINHVAEKQTIWWEIYDKSGKNLLDKSGVEQIDTAVCCSMLKSFLETQADDWFIVNYKHNISPNTKPFVNTFRNANTNNFSYSNEATKQNITPSLSNDEIQARIDIGIQQGLTILKEQMRVNQLELEVVQLRKIVADNEPSEADKVIGRIGQILLPTINNYMKNNNSVEISGEEEIEGNSKEEILANSTKKLFEKIENTGKDVTDVVKKLSEIDPEKLKMLLNML